MEQNDQIKRINRENREFWDRQRNLMNERLENKALVAVAQMLIQSETIFSRMIPFEQALERAEKAEKIFSRHRARIAGKQKKVDALQVVIIDEVQQDQAISEKKLLQRLLEKIDAAPITAIDSEEGVIRFFSSPKIIKQTTISSLKDRLSRAKKFVKAS